MKTGNYLKLETICVLLQHSPIRNYLKLFEVRNFLWPPATQPFSSFGYTHTDRRALPGAVNTTPLKHKREQETDVEKTISTKNPCHLFPSCHSISLVLKYFCHWGLCQSAKLVCHETHNESTQHQWASEWETFVCQVYNFASEIQSLFTIILYVDFCKKRKRFYCINYALGSVMWCWFFRRLQSHIDEQSRWLSKAGTHRE